MEENITIEKAYESSRYRSLSISEIKEQLATLEIKELKIYDSALITIWGKTSKIIYTDYEHPFTLKSGTLYINSDWYIQNQREGDNLLNYIATNNNEEGLSICSRCLITKELIYSLASNPNLVTISLTGIEDDLYKLSLEDYKVLKSSNVNKIVTDGVEKELDEMFDPIIHHNNIKPLLGNYNYQSLQTSTRLILDGNCLKEDQLENVKYLNSQSRIYLNDYQLNVLVPVVKALQKFNKTNEVVLAFSNKEKLNKILFSGQINYENLIISYDNGQYPVSQYMNFEKKLYDMIEPAKDLSPFEKYIFAYNMVKKFKKYKESEENALLSRNLYSVLINEYMVCVGFDNMFRDLITKLGIESTKCSLTIDTSYDDVKYSEMPTLDNKIVNKEGHARSRVHIVDPKYGIDGYYIADPTWDNDLERDKYNYLAITDKKTTLARRYVWAKYDFGQEYIEELFNVSSIDEFYQKINFILSRNNNKDSILDITNKLMARLEDLDYSYISNLMARTTIDDNDWVQSNFSEEVISDILSDIGNHIVSKVNKEIPVDVMMAGIGNVYKKAYGYTNEQWLNEMKQILEVNKVYEAAAFPIRKKIDNYGNEEIIMNENNMFDVDINSFKTR